MVLTNKSDGIQPMLGRSCENAGKDKMLRESEGCRLTLNWDEGPRTWVWTILHCIFL